MEPLGTAMKSKCSIIFRDFFIRWDGNIAICCNDFRGEYSVTNIRHCARLEEAYFHKRLESARKFLIRGDRAAVYPCSVCNVRAIRPGLLPDSAGKVKLGLPTGDDKMIVKLRKEPLAIIEKRKWEAKDD